MTAMALAIMLVAIVTVTGGGLARARPLVLASLLECPLLGVKRTLGRRS